MLSAEATEVCSCGGLPDCNSRPLGNLWVGWDQLHWEMVVLVGNYKGVRRPVPALGANCGLFSCLFCLWGARSGLGLPSCSVRVRGAPQGGYLLVPWAPLTAALWRTVTYLPQ